MHFAKIKAIIIVVTILFPNVLFAQTKHISTIFTTEHPIIDGKINEPIWNNTNIANNFIQYLPYNNEKPTNQTEVKILYDNKAIYIAARIFDSKDSIATFLSERDDFGQADYFGFYIDPFNDGLNAYGFFVTAAGVQIDAKTDGISNDYNWDAIWYSKISIDSIGWIVEMEIPFSALRFPTNTENNWGINFYRNIQRHREISTWNYIDQNFTEIYNQMGELLGLKNLNSPIRLSLIPYVSYYKEEHTKTHNQGKYFKGGLDVKYGISESFTLDMMLIPDFGDIKSDDKILNLSPYETYYDEKRAFFTEGTELFNRANIFYSRRIGAKPVQYNTLASLINESEKIIENPTETQILNATKITGKTKNGFSIGFLNGITAQTNAIIKDTISQEERKIVTQSLTNYNVSVIDKSLPNNSYISLINTHLSRFDEHYFANVTGTQFRLSNSKKSIAIYGSGALNLIYNNSNKAETGHYYNVGISKTNGEFRVGLNHRLYTDTYNPNDLGYLSKNNYMYYSASVSYNKYKPFWNLLNWRNSASVTYNSLYKPKKHVGASFNFGSAATFKNHLSTGINFTINPIQRDYYESRVPERVYLEPGKQNASIYFSSDYSKRVAFDLVLGVSQTESQKQTGSWLILSPRLRLTNKLMFIYQYHIESDENNYGFVDKTEDNDTIFFGKRNVNTVSNTVNLSYIFNNRSSLNLYVRHYWTRVKYFDYYTLQLDGSLQEITRSYRYIDHENINYNTFNFDLVYSWQFSPGSELSLVWKKTLNRDNGEIINDYWDNLEVLFIDGHLNSISIKLLYYIDYFYLKNKKLHF